MKTKSKKIDQQLYNLFKDVFTDEEEIMEAIRDTKKAFSMVQADVLYRNPFSEEL